MSTYYNDIRAALDVHLDDHVFAQSLPPVAWEGIPYDPSGEYFSQFFLPGQTSPSSMGDTGLDLTEGIYQINVNVPAGKGTARLNELADSIATRFKPRQYLTYNGVSVQIRSVSRNQATNDGKYMTSVIDIEFETYTTQRA